MSSSSIKALRAENHPLYTEWRSVWRHVLQNVNPLKPGQEHKPYLGKKALEHPGGSPVMIALDASFDGVCSAYVGLVLAYGEKPRVIYKAGRFARNDKDIERWAMNHAINRTKKRYSPLRPIVIINDSLNAMRYRQNSRRIHFLWMQRERSLIRALHDAANALRRSQPLTPEELIRLHKFSKRVVMEKRSRRSAPANE